MNSESSGALIVFLFILLIWASFIVSIAGLSKPVELIQSSTECRDGIVQQGRGEDWVPVTIKGSKRTIPCPFPEG